MEALINLKTGALVLTEYVPLLCETLTLDISIERDDETAAPFLVVRREGDSTPVRSFRSLAEFHDALKVQP